MQQIATCDCNACLAIAMLFAIVTFFLVQNKKKPMTDKNHNNQPYPFISFPSTISPNQQISAAVGLKNRGREGPSHDVQHFNATVAAQPDAGTAAVWRAHDNFTASMRMLRWQQEEKTRPIPYKDKGTLFL